MLYLDNQKPTSSVQNTRPPKQNVKNTVKEDPQKTNTTNNPKVHLFKIIFYIFIGYFAFWKQSKTSFVYMKMK